MSEPGEPEHSPGNIKILCVMLGKAWTLLCVYFITVQCIIWLFEKITKDLPAVQATLNQGWMYLPNMIIVHIVSIIITAASMHCSKV